jgi:hypothetical protein
MSFHQLTGLLFALALALTAAPASALPAGIPLPPSAAELGLTPAQQGEWEAIRSDALAFRQSLLEELALGLPALEADLSAPDADLGAISQRLQSQLLYAAWRSQPIRQRRLAFYQSLDPAQQMIVREWLAEVVNRLQRVVSATQLLSAP